MDLAARITVASLDATGGVELVRPFELECTFADAEALVVLWTTERARELERPGLQSTR